MRSPLGSVGSLWRLASVQLTAVDTARSSVDVAASSPAKALRPLPHRVVVRETCPVWNPPAAPGNALCLSRAIRGADWHSESRGATSLWPDALGSRGMRSARSNEAVAVTSPQSARASSGGDWLSALPTARVTVAALTPGEGRSPGFHRACFIVGGQGAPACAADHRGQGWPSERRGLRRSRRPITAARRRRPRGGSAATG